MRRESLQTVSAVTIAIGTILLAILTALIYFHGG
jgi:hypothetical protein